MKRNLLIGALVASGALAGASLADQIVLEGVVRDFQDTHADMNYPNKNFGVRTNLVLPTLSEDGKPMLNTSVNYNNGMITSVNSFNQWYRDVPGVNIAIPYSITLDNGQEEPGGVYRFVREINNGGYFFPIDDQGWNDDEMAADGRYHNFYFTYELHTQFLYTDPADRDDTMTFTFTGDDDVWVFINGKKVVDIGGVHGQASASVDVDAKAAELGMTPGNVYALDFFFAERHVTQSNFRMETTLTLQSIPPTTTNPLYD